MLETHPEAAGGSPSIVQLMVGVFTNPRATFTSLNASITLKDIIIPWVILIVVSLSAQSVIRPIAIDEQYNRIERRQDIPEEQKEAILERIESLVVNTSGMRPYLIGGLVSVAWMGVLAGVFMFFGAIILGGQAPYQKALAVTVFISLIGLLELVVKVPLILQSGSTQVETGLALLLPASLDGSLIARFFHRLDFFDTWKVALAAMGTAVIFQVSEQRALRVYFAAWVAVMFLLAWLIDGRFFA